MKINLTANSTKLNGKEVLSKASTEAKDLATMLKFKLFGETA